MSKRKYTKKSDYWDKRKANSEVKASTSPILSSGIKEELIKESNSLKPAMVGSPFYQGQSYSATASTRRVLTKDGDESNYRITRRHIKSTPDEYANIRAGMLPYKSSSNGIDVRDAILLCQKAYTNVAVFRMAVEIMAELSNSTLKLKGGTEKSRNFIKHWLKKVGIKKLKDQYFREYYRSGNIFTYRIDGTIQTEDFNKLKKKYSLSPKAQKVLPLRYILLNPYDITAEHASSFSNKIYKKIFSQYELERLKEPKTDSDREIYNNLPSEVKSKIKDNTWLKNGVEIKLDPKVMSYSFYKKQDYEPFAVPFGFPVLSDINWKLELKKIDQAVCRTIENVILLITMGASKKDGGINSAAMNAMQELFQTESVGRVLVADYTTEAEFIIPDIEKIIGPEKYKIVNEDIKQGLQNVIVGDEKHSNTQIKTQIFLERLKESREAFIEDFLQPEIERVCKSMGLQGVPEAIFAEIDIKDEANLQRVASRLIELGVLTPEQGVDVIKTGIYPDPEELLPAQKEFIKQRKDHLWTPLVGGESLVDDNPTNPDEKAPKKTPKKAGRPGGTQNIKQEKTREFSQSKLTETIKAINDFNEAGYKSFKSKRNIKKMSNEYKGLVESLCEKIIIGYKINEWSSVFEECMNDFNKIGELKTHKSVLEISEEHNLTEYASALLWHSEKK